MSRFTLDELDKVVAARLSDGDATSYTRKLAARGVGKCAQKLGEEAVEAAIAAVSGSPEELVAESADLLFHLLVLLRVRGLDLATVLAELERRQGRSGLEEKASRPRD